MKWIYLDVTLCLLTLTLLTLVQIEVNSEPLSVIHTCKEGLCIGPGLVRMSDASSRSRTKMSGHSHGKLLGHIQDQLFVYLPLK